MEPIKREYKPPKLVEHGKLQELTRGATGPDTDYHWTGTGLTNIGPCTSNTGNCVTFS